MLTCCPGCSTTFRVTPEQLKARAGKVRCGKCQAVFNALDTLLEAPAGPAEGSPACPAGELAAAMTTPPPAATGPSQEKSANSDEKPTFSGEEVDILLESTSPEPVPPVLAKPPEEPPAEPPSTSAASVHDKALAAGLVAARETTQIPGYNKWAEGAFTGTTTVLAEPPPRTLWPFLLAALLLLLALAGQLAHHFRGELALAHPGLQPLLAAACTALDCEIPLPRHAELVSIETSDLQIDPARGGMLTLTATLINRATYAQAWPLLEITLTDVRDDAILRRVLEPVDYLPAKSDPTLFPPNGEIGIRLWLEARDVAAAGYRLYVFYP